MRLTELYARLAAGQISDADAERLDTRHRPPTPRKRGGTRPRKPEHIERRRGWAGTARLPLHVARHFALAGQAVLAVVAREIRQTGDCRKSLKELADMAGCSERTVRNTLSTAKALRFLSVEERRIYRHRNLTNVVRIIDPLWLRQGGGKTVPPLSNQYVILPPSRSPEADTRIRPSGHEPVHRLGSTSGG